MRKVSLRRLRLRLQHEMGFDRLKEQFPTFAAMNLGFQTFTNLQLIFVNTLFYRLTGNAQIVMQYNMLTYAFTGLGMVLSVFSAKRMGTSVTVKLGLVFNVLMYVVFFLFQENLTAVMPLIAGLAAVGTGLYNLGYTMCIIQFSDDNSRDVALALISMTNGIVSVVMPPISGYVISRFEGFAGYYVMFGFSLVIGIVTMGICSRLRFEANEKQPTHYLRALKASLTSKLWMSGQLAEFFRGFREGTFVFYLNILLFSQVQSEALVGFNTVVVGVTSLAALRIMGQRVNPRNRLRWMYLSTTALLIAVAALFLKLDVLTIVLLSAANAFFAPFFINPPYGIFLTAVQLGTDLSTRYEHIAIKNVFLDLGRVVGIYLVYRLPQTVAWSIGGMLILTLSQYVGAVLCQNTVRLIHLRYGRPEER